MNVIKHLGKLSLILGILFVISCDKEDATPTKSRK